VRRADRCSFEVLSSGIVPTHETRSMASRREGKTPVADGRRELVSDAFVAMVAPQTGDPETGHEIRSDSR
jgi:hypothetical protein